MGWSYEFVELSKAERLARRVVLDRYGLYAQLSAIFLIVLVALVRLSLWGFDRFAARRVAYDVVPTSPAVKPWEKTPSSFNAKRRKVVWWLGEDVTVFGRSLGQRDQVIYGTAWVAWLLVLSFRETGKDYLHLTKRFGAIGVSQLPLQYLLSLKRFNPVALVFRTSHEHVNRWHRVLGYISYVFIVCHGILYFNYFVQTSNLIALTHMVPFLGVMSLVSMTLLVGTVFPLIRKYSYRAFYLTHLAVAAALPPLVWFHVHHSRVFMTECFFIFILDLVGRRLNTVRTSAVVEFIDGTNLIKVVATAPTKKAGQFGTRPASHAYLSTLSGTSWWSTLRSTFSSNPFTVAHVDEAASEVTFVARQMRGPTTSRFAKLAGQQPGDGQLATISLEGPYGAAGDFPDLSGSQFDQILLVAGGVGATFVLPLYRYLMATGTSAGVRIIWSVRSLDEATWPGFDAENTVQSDERIQLFVTGGKLPAAAARASSDSSNDVELSELDKQDAPPSVPVENYRRPDLRKIVDDVFGQSPRDRVAVVVCGPEQMARDLRKAVGAWVSTGRNAWFYNENFGW